MCGVFHLAIILSRDGDDDDYYNNSNSIIPFIKLIYIYLFIVSILIMIYVTNKLLKNYIVCFVSF